MKHLNAPNTNFAAVRDGRNSQVFYFDVDLTAARSVAANTQQVFNISGNSFYIDADPTDGNAIVHFQDTNFDRGPVPLYVSPGTIFSIPFTQILLENVAQPGKTIRICYGVDVDFQPGSVSQIAVTNNGGFTAVRPEAQTGFYSSTSAIAAATADPVFLPAANVNGAILLSADINSFDNAATGVGAFVTKASAPASIIDGSMMLISKQGPSGGLSLTGGARLEFPQYIAAGQGLYYITSVAFAAAVASAFCYRGCRYKLL